MGKLNINNGGVDTNKVMPSIDERFGPYASREAVEAEFGKEGRDAKCAGLTVGVTQSDGSVKEFWYQPDGQGGLELVEKQAESSNVFGYYNSSNGKFYKEDSYKTEITGGEDKIYIDLSTNTMLRYDVAGSVYEPLGDSEVDKRVNGVVKESYYKRTSANVGEYAEYGTNYNSSWRYLDLSVRKGETVFYKAVGHYGSNPIQPVSFVDSNGILKLKIEYSSQNPICEGVYTAPSDGVFTINMREDSSGWDDAYLYVIRASSERKVSGVVNNSKYKRTESENNDYANYDIVGNPNWRYIDLSVRKDETVFYRSVGHSGIVQPASFADSNGILRMLIQAPSSTTTYENTYTAPDNGVFTVNVRHDDGGWDDAYLYVIRSSSGGGASNESVIQLADFVDGMQGRDGVRVSRASMENAGVIDLSEIFPHMNKFGNKLQLTAKVTTMGTLQFRFGPIPASGYIEAYGYHLLTIDDTNIKLYKAIESDILTDTVPHGLTITDYISVNLNCLADGTMKVEVNTNDNNLNSTGRFSCVLDKWNYGVGHIRVISDQCVLTDVQLSVTNEMFRCPFWMFGASQEGLSDIRYAGQLMKMGYLNVLDNARSGRTSEYLIEDLRRALVFGCPKYLFYTFSNDGLDPNVYEQRVNTIIDIADSHDIKLIVKIVAVVSVGEDGAKELAKRNFILNLLSENKIYRVFDFGKAVSANPTDPNELYEDYLDSALIHPKNAKAATAVAMQFLADVPEIMQYGVKSAEITVDDALSSTSENPVQNKVVKSALDAKAPSSNIQKNALASGVQTSLDKADTALQHSDNYVKTGNSSGESSVTDFDPYNDTVHNSAQALSPSQQAQVRQNINAQETISDLQQIRTRADEGHTALQQVTVGTTTTGAAGTNASVTNSGTAQNPVLDFTIPRGADGANGQSIKYINAEEVEDLPTASSSYSNVVALVPSTTQQGVVDQYACIENAVIEGQVVSGWSWVLIGTTAPIVSVQEVDTYQPMLPVKIVGSYVAKSTGVFNSSSTLETVIYDISDAKKLVCDFTVIAAGTLSLSFFDDGLDINDLSTASSHYLGWRVDKSKSPYVVTENTQFENQIINVDDDATLGQGDITNARYVGLTRLISSHFGVVSVLTPVPQSLVKKQPIALNEILIFNTLIQLPQIWSSDVADATEITTQQTLSTWGVVFPSTYTNIGKPTPIIAMLHGLSGYVANGVLGYSTAGWIASRQAYLDAGFAVIDINGYGTGDSDDQDSRPWGNPASVETLDKAFEYLKQNYNICDKLLIAGISMGGILAMSYAKRFPGKVSAVGLFAPNLLAYTIRYLPSTDQQVPNSKEIAWGYFDHSEAAADNYNHLTGYVLLNKCNCVDNGIVKPYAWPSEKPSTWPDNLTDLELIEYFPVAMRVWQGTSDTSVNPNCSKLLVKSLRNGNSDATLRLCQGANHDVQNVQYVRNEAVSWFKRFVNV